ncbi:cell wall hydrolase [Sphingobium sp.]|uniref:cell wall hydrolase n=1 Tax=Sphingobium sp. TaxID=1912891 RepID=UPI003B3B6814
MKNPVRLLILLSAPTILFVATAFIGYLILDGDTFRAGTAAPHTAAMADKALPPVPALPSMKLMDLPPVEARAVNARTAFVQDGIQIAQPFLFAGNPTDRNRGQTCLAAALLYEAGDDPVGQAAVAQVVINRLRHPAFPKSLCGVVLQGWERSSGCQFTFTCDGAMKRKPSPAAWLRAKAAAGAAMSGAVFGGVGLATHYHTDWVVPYWSASLDKIAQVGTHLFFRWPGIYGRPPAFRGAYEGGEILNPAMQALAEADQLTAATQAIDTGTDIIPLPKRIELPGISGADLQGSSVRQADAASGQFILRLEPGAFPGSYAVLAYKMCEGKPACDIWGWTDPMAMPRALPVTLADQRTASFHFHKSGQSPTGIAQWNCREFKRASASQCLPDTMP